MDEKAVALSIGGFILGSAKSRFVTTSHVMAHHPNHPDYLYLARIEHFAKLKVRGYYYQYLDSFFGKHQCKVWFGGPTEVCTRTTYLDAFYIPLHDIKTRVAYCEKLVDFGRVIGKKRCMLCPFYLILAIKYCVAVNLVVLLCCIIIHDPILLYYYS